MEKLTKLVVLPVFMFLGTGVAQATTIPSPISATLTITTDSQLTSNVSCTVTGAPCIKFGAPGIKLKLNGFTMTGNGGQTSCRPNLETGIDTNLQNNVFVRGPGLVRRVNGTGIVVSGNHSSVEGVAVTIICGDGIDVFGSHNEVEGNSVSRASLAGFSGGISVGGSGGHRILHNEVVGVIGGSPGILVNPQSINNLIEENDASGNPAGGIFFVVGSTGNIVRHNQALGNGGDDIFDGNAFGANKYDNNLCEVSNIGICKLPDIAGHRNFIPDGD